MRHLLLCPKCHHSVDSSWYQELFVGGSLGCAETSWVDNPDSQLHKALPMYTCGLGRDVDSPQVHVKYLFRKHCCWYILPC